MGRDDFAGSRGLAFRTLPPAVDTADTIESVEPDDAPAPEAGRNLDQHRALRDD